MLTIWHGSLGNRRIKVAAEFSYLPIFGFRFQILMQNSDIAVRSIFARQPARDDFRRFFQNLATLGNRALDPPGRAGSAPGPGLLFFFIIFYFYAIQFASKSYKVCFLLLSNGATLAPHLETMQLPLRSTKASRSKFPS